MTAAGERTAASRNAALLLSVAVAALGAAVLAGWALDIAFLTSVLPGGVTMKANTAICMLLSGMALALLSRGNVGNRARLFATVAACAGIAVGALSLSESFLGWDLGIDQWMFREAPGAVETTSLGRMSPPASFCFILTGIALLLASRPFSARIRSVVVLAISVTVILAGGLALLGHLLLALFNIRFWNYAGLAMHTSTGLLLLGCALLAWVRGEDSSTWALDARTSAGFAVGIVSILLAAGVSYSFTDQLRQDASWVARSEEVLKEIQELTASQKDLTLSLGRYLITHDESSVANRARIKAAIQEDTDHIRRLTGDNPRQQIRLSRVEQLTAQRVAMSDQIIAKIRQQSLGASTQPAARSGESPLGNEYPAVGEDVDRVLKEMEADEYALLQQRLARSDTSATRTFLLMPLGVYLSLTMLLLGLFFLNSGTVERKRIEQIRARLATIVESSDDAIIGKRLDGIVTNWNAGAEHLFGYTAQEMVGKSITLIIPHDRLHEEGMIVAQIAKGETVRHYETVRRRKDGTLIDISVSVSPIRDTNGIVVGASKIARDVTQRKQAEDKIKRLNRVYAVLSGINNLIVRTRDREELFRGACRIAVEQGAFKMAWIGEIDPETLDGKVVAWCGGEESYVEKIPITARDGTPASDRPACRALRLTQPVISNDIATDPSVAPIRKDLLARGHKSIGCFPLTLNARAEAVLSLCSGEVNTFDEGEMRLLRELAGDISFALDHIQKAEHLDYLAYYDEVTGLANRTLFRERVGQFISAAGREGKMLAIAKIDIERFKTINDTFGRQAGDALLRQIAKRARLAVTDPNWLACTGGDRFAAVFPDMARVGDAARRVALRYKEIFEAPFDIGGTELRVAARLGIAMFPDDGADADTLMRNAESALKKAKASGERYLFYAQQMTERVAERLNLENKLRRAVEKEEFVLHYQPKVDLATGAITGAEALIRWNDPETGLVPPGHFIQLLEETGLILEVGSWALTQAVRDHSHWLDLGVPAPRIAVNVSPIQLRQRDFVETVKRAISLGASPTGIDLEITESLVMEDVDGNIAKLGAIREMGMTIFIDDFGTGYSSLGYLAKLPVQSLKIDRSFVITMLKDPNTMTLVSTIISLAHSLKLKVVAEGVDQEDQAQVLRQLGCEQMQGYLFSKPVSRDQITVLLAQSPVKPTAGQM